MLCNAVTLFMAMQIKLIVVVVVVVVGKNIAVHTYLVLTEFEVRPESYGPSFFPSAYGPSAKCAGRKSTGINEDPKLTVRTEKTRLVRYLLYL